jgi:formylglycine-generating enzyme required for sulfatase activity
MKYTLFLLLLLHTAHTFAQKNDCNSIYPKAQAAEKAGNEVAAVKGYIATITCDESRAVEIAPKLEAVFNKLRKQKKDALKAQKDAEAAKQKAEAAQNRALQLLSDIVARDLTKVQELIIDMEYETAYKILQSAASLGEDLGAKKAATIAGLIEVAYYFTETGKLAKADSLLQMANHLQPKSEAAALLPQIASEKDSLHKQALLQKALPQLDLATWQMCEKRYFPDMVLVEGGTFTMGCDSLAESDCEDANKDLHEVSLDNFQMSRTEVTVWQFSLYCATVGKNLNDFSYSWKQQGNNPIINVMWYDAAEYSNWLTMKLLAKGKPRYLFVEVAGKKAYERFKGIDTLAQNYYHLPSEAQWEYAARGGNKQPAKHERYSGSNSIDKVGWYNEHPKMNAKRTQAVATLDANALGLYDMSGNVWEWCEDRYADEYYEECKKKGTVINPIYLKRGSYRVNRGGGWGNYAGYCTSAYRSYDMPSVMYDSLGFRLVRKE